MVQRALTKHTGKTVALAGKIRAALVQRETVRGLGTQEAGKDEMSCYFYTMALLIQGKEYEC
jgi:hypothetical protein